MILVDHYLHKIRLYVRVYKDRTSGFVIIFYSNSSNPSGN